jgi:hypothetical protein
MTLTKHRRGVQLDEYLEGDLVVWISTTRPECRYILAVVLRKGEVAEKGEQLYVVQLLPAGPLPQQRCSLKCSSMWLFEAASPQSRGSDMSFRDAETRRVRTNKPLLPTRSAFTQRQWTTRLYRRYHRELHRRIPHWMIYMPLELDDELLEGIDVNLALTDGTTLA